MKFTDGLFSESFRSIAAEYPDLVTEHMLVDIGAARVAARPECFDVIVAPNLYGDILSDIAAEVRRPSPCLLSLAFGKHPPRRSISACR